MFRKKLACSFRGERDFEVEKLVAGPRVYGVAGPRVYICDKCVAVANQIIQASFAEEQVRDTGGHACV